MLSRATSNKVFCLVPMPKWFSATYLNRQYVFNKANCFQLVLNKESNIYRPQQLIFP